MGDQGRVLASMRRPILGSLPRGRFRCGALLPCDGLASEGAASAATASRTRAVHFKGAYHLRLFEAGRSLASQYFTIVLRVAYTVLRVFCNVRTLYNTHSLSYASRLVVLQMQHLWPGSYRFRILQRPGLVWRQRA